MDIRQHRINSQSGFTLVELAIVMMIIGLLIGGILKGQEMLENARVDDTIRDIKATDAGVTTFRDIYSRIPGDMAVAQNRLPDCNAGTFCLNGDGNNLLDGNNDLGRRINNNTSERYQFFRQLLAADLLNNVMPSGTIAFGDGLPAAEVGGGFRVGSHDGSTPFRGTVGITSKAGMYMELTGDPTKHANAQPQGAMPLTPAQAAHLDRKMDDGQANTGAVVGYDAAGGNCLAVTPSGYNETAGDIDCGLYIRIQG